MNRPAADATMTARQFEEILHHISHDVRATLRALKTLPGWLREDLVASGSTPRTSVLEILEMIETQAARADRMMVGLRSYSRIGQTSDAASMVPLQEAIDGACERLSLPPGFRVETDLQIRAVAAPRNEFREMITVLLSNAVVHHHRDDGTITVRSWSDSDQICISVEDDGPGIPKPYRNRVFDLLATLRSGDDACGCGLGLPTARRIVALLGGTISAEDPAGDVGARLLIRLPSHVAAAT